MMDSHSNCNNFLIHEFLGMPKTGKSESIEILADKLKKSNFNVEIINEGTQNCPFDKGKSHFLYTQWGLKKTIQSLEKICLPNKDKTVILIDRGPFDRLLFIQTQIDYGYINKNQGRALIRLSKEFWNHINSISLYLCSPEIAIQREKKQGRVGEGRIMNLPFLRILYQNYIDFAKNQNIPNLIIIDSEKNSLQKNTNLVFNHILCLLK